MNSRANPAKVRARLTLLHVAKRQLGLTEEDYRAILWTYGGVASSKALTTANFDAVMERMRELGFTTARRGMAFGRRIGMASPQQLELIQALWSEVSAEPTDAALGRWISKHHSISALRFVDYQRASKIIGALKAWKRRLGGVHGPE